MLGPCCASTELVVFPKPACGDALHCIRHSNNFWLSMTGMQSYLPVRAPFGKPASDLSDEIVLILFTDP